MLLKSLRPVVAAAVATAASTLRQAPTYPPVSTANAFTLVANVTGDQTAIFTPLIGASNWSLVGNHIGANLNLGILYPGAGHVFFVNGTGPEVSSQSTSIGLPPTYYVDAAGTVIYEPVGMIFASDGVEASILLDIGDATKGAGVVGGLRSPWPLLFTPFREGVYSVCNVSNSAYGNPQYRVSIVVGGVDSVIPENCVSISLLAQCADLPELLGAEELNIVVEGVPCYEDVSAIDWSSYSPVPSMI